MIRAYRQLADCIQVDTLSLDASLPPDSIWLDVVEPEPQERKWLDRYFVEEVPEAQDINEIEASSRFFIDKDGLHIHSFFPHRAGKEIRNISISFNLRENLLITIRDEDVGIFRLFRKYIHRGQVQLNSPENVFIFLFITKIDYLADQLEEVYSALEKVSLEVLEEGTGVADIKNPDAILKNITMQEDFNGKIRLGLLDSERSLRYLIRNRRNQLKDEQQQYIRDMLRDIDSLLPHTAFLFEKVNFLLEAIMGFINLEQNRVTKIFSVAAVIFLPPTLIASVYGMNFKTMPELGLSWGYPMSIGLMVLSAVGTFLFFRCKKWL